MRSRLFRVRDVDMRAVSIEEAIDEALVEMREHLAPCRVELVEAKLTVVSSLRGIVIITADIGPAED